MTLVSPPRWVRTVAVSIDAWMSLNEAVPGPGSDQFQEKPEETSRRLAAYDRFQVAFHHRLQEARGVDAIAFNFGAGNFGRPAALSRPFSTARWRGLHLPRLPRIWLADHVPGLPTALPAQGPTAPAWRGSARAMAISIGSSSPRPGLTRMYQECDLGR